MAYDALVGPVRGFVDGLAPTLVGLGAKPEDVSLEAFNIAAAFTDVDGLHTDDELLHLMVAFGPLMETVALCTSPGDVRRSELVKGKRRFLEAPSTVFEILVGTDKRSGSANAWRYHELATDIAHTVCSLDSHTSHAELMALERFRAVLLRTMDLAGLPRPGRPAVDGLPTRPVDGDPRAASTMPQPADIPRRTVEELLAELEALVGLQAVKAEVRQVVNLLRIQRLREQRGLPVVEGSRHLVFTGNPGTGKTTVARLLAQIYRELEVVERGQLVETDRSGLVVGYVGQTATRVAEVFRSALGGVLLIDEAYALARGNESDFGKEAIDTLVKLMEDHREDVVVIAAGYTGEMEVFIESNPGLRSRFPKTIHFPDYSDGELLAIVDSLCAKSRYHLDDSARAKVQTFFATQVRDKGFGNARLSRNLFEEAVARQASRLVVLKDVTDEQLTTFTAHDVPDAVAPT